MALDSRGATADQSTVKRALLEIRELKARERARTEPIAIVGLGCRFPDSPGPDAFWQLLAEGREGVGDIPADRWDVDSFYDPDPERLGRMYTKRGGFLRDIDRFDPAFFGITPREAAGMDPQQRLLLEVSWEALEHAGEAPDRLMGERVGVFVGAGATDHLARQLRGVLPAEIDAYLATGASAAVVSGRVSYTFGFQGPSLTIDTACSASLVAVHQACQSLRADECRMALAGGVSLMLLPELTINFCRARMLAADGRCKTFDAAADGYVRSEGCGVVVLKRLSEAIAAGNRVLAVIRGSAVNQDGRSSGLTVPNGPAQEAVVRDALVQARLAPADIDYIEAHGTGTALGDPIEVNALGAVFAPGRPADHRLIIGSAKTNIGHLEGAAGIAGLIKIVLAMQHGQIPAHLHFDTPNPHIPWNQLPFDVPTTSRPWPLRQGRRAAGVSSFGFSGTNAHVVIESAPGDAPREPDRAGDRRLHLLPLSARSDAALGELIVRMARHLYGHPDAALADVAATASTGRFHFPHRLAVVAESTAEAAAILDRYAAGDRTSAAFAGRVPAARGGVAFLFTGQGAQYAGMGRGLYDDEPVFRAALDRCDEILRPHLDRSILDLMFDRDGAGVLLDQTVYAQPALFAFEYALAEQWRAWGVSPSVVMGHSLGEDVAACIAGVFSLEDGLQLIANRGRLMQALPSGGEMHAVFADPSRVTAIIGADADEVAVAAINAPDQVTISGRTSVMERVLRRLATDGVRTRSVTTSHAFHSTLMDPMLDEFEVAAQRVTYSEPRITLVSNVSGRVAVPADVCDPHYWRRHVREPVRFADAVRSAWDLGARIFVEIGPAPVLTGMGRRSVSDADSGVWIAPFRKGHDESRGMLEALATLYTHGASIDWEGVWRDRSARRVTLPTYPFERDRHWTVVRSKPVAPPIHPDVRWTHVSAAAARQSLEGPLDLAIGTMQEKWAQLDALSLAFLTDALRQLGMFTRPGERHTAASLCRAARIPETYQPLMRRWLDALASVGRLRADGDACIADVPLPAVDPHALVTAARPLFADFPPILEYVDRCGNMLADVLTGRESALETLFPNGSPDLANAIYNQWPVSRYFNGIVRAAVIALAATATPERPLRILEIGAGTGSTSAGLFPALPADRVRYAFTDVGALFLARARERFTEFPFVDYVQLDIEQAPSEQGFQAHTWDVIVAANVLHATQNLRQTIDYVSWLLASSGTLVMYEATRHPLWMDVTTGLISGWQAFRDDLRTDSPLVSSDVWERVVRAQGFDAFITCPAAGSAADVLAQHVLIARGPQLAGAHQDAAWDGPLAVPNSAFIDVAGGAAPDRAPDVRAHLASLPPADRREALASFVRDRVIAVLRLDPKHAPGREQGLMELGIDSLMAVELRNQLVTGLGGGIKLPATLIFDYPTIDAIAGLVQGMIGGRDGGASAGVDPVTTRAASPATATASEIEQLDDDAAEALLNKRLENL